MRRPAKPAPALKPPGQPAGDPRLLSLGWIDSEQGVAFTASAMPRVRDSLLLRVVANKRSGRGRSASDAPGA